VFCVVHTVFFIIAHIKTVEIIHVFYLGFLTGSRIFILVILCSVIWIPIGVWIGLRPRLTQWIQPWIQFVAAFPANLLYPGVVLGIITFKANPEIWTAPLMVLGTQWYILFNVIAGTSQIPEEIHEAINGLKLNKRLWWKRFILPAIFPYYITGAMTAAGGAWNASILAEVVSWGDTTLTATGLGAYITAATQTGDFTRLALGTTVMSFYVVCLNHLLWRRLYRIASKRFELEEVPHP
jgi:NitT/TauT family transport system permease protein